MAERWVFVEDTRLKKFLDKVKGPDNPLKVLEEKFGGLSSMLEWKKLRIPEKERAAVIERFYRVKLQKARRRAAALL